MPYFHWVRCVRVLKVPGVAALALALHAYAHAAPNPAGGYAQTCRDISVSGTTLRATCKNMAGNWAVPSSLSNYAGCVGEIFNHNGVLKCAGGTPPGGSYRSTCTDVNLDANGTLYGVCRKMDGGRLISTLQVAGCRQNISNVDGHLRCDDVGPAGSYRQTCWNIQNQDSLSAQCRTRNGGNKATQMAGVQWRECVALRADITNDDGSLRCSQTRRPPSQAGGGATGGGDTPCQPGNPNRDPKCGVTFVPVPPGTGLPRAAKPAP